MPKYFLSLKIYWYLTFWTALEMCRIICTNERSSQLGVWLQLSSPINTISVVFLKSVFIVWFLCQKPSVSPRIYKTQPELLSILMMPLTLLLYISLFSLVSWVIWCLYDILAFTSVGLPLPLQQLFYLFLFSNLSFFHSSYTTSYLVSSFLFLPCPFFSCTTNNLITSSLKKNEST